MSPVKIAAPIVTAALFGLGLLVASGVLPPQPAKAGSVAAQSKGPPSNPGCGLTNQYGYPDCPVSSDDERIAEGFRIAPVPLDLTGQDPQKVGVGAYWVNSAGACDGCHASPTLGGVWVANANPYQLPINLGGTYAYATVADPYNPVAFLNPASYLGGGNNFGDPNCDNAGGGGCGPILIVRNLTPDFSTGVPMAAGLTYDQFKLALQTGHDSQQVHLNCSSTNTSPYCLNAPSDGTKLQVMPWPALSGATEYDLESIYAYLSSIPCISNAGSQYPQIIHTCSAASAARHHKYSYDKGHLTQLD